MVLEDSTLLSLKKKDFLFGYAYFHYPKVVFHHLFHIEWSLIRESIQSFLWITVVDLTNQGYNGNRFEYILHFKNLLVNVPMLSYSHCVVAKRLIMLFLASILILKQNMSLRQRSWRSSMDSGSRLWYNTWVDPHNIIEKILHVTLLFWITNYSVITCFWTPLVF